MAKSTTKRIKAASSATRPKEKMRSDHNLSTIKMMARKTRQRSAKLMRATPINKKGAIFDNKKEETETCFNAVKVSVKEAGHSNMF